VSIGSHRETRGKHKTDYLVDTKTKSGTKDWWHREGEKEITGVSVGGAVDGGGGTMGNPIVWQRRTQIGKQNMLV